MIQQESGKTRGKSLTIKDFFKEYQKDCKTYPKEYFDLNGKENKAKRKVSFSLFRAIVKTYMKIYFTEFFTSKMNHMYFFFPGDLYLKRIPGKLLIMNNGRTIISRDKVSFSWVNRSCSRAYHFIKLKKHRSISNLLIKLEEDYLSNNDIELIEDYVTFTKRLDESKTLFKKI